MTAPVSAVVVSAATNAGHRADAVIPILARWRDPLTVMPINVAIVVEDAIPNADIVANEIATGMLEHVGCASLDRIREVFVGYYVTITTGPK